jgi:hypothetical protein
MADCDTTSIGKHCAVHFAAISSRHLSTPGPSAGPTAGRDHLTCICMHRTMHSPEGICSLTDMWDSMPGSVRTPQ